MLDLLADDVLLRLANDWVNPRDQRRLASVNKRFYNLLPGPLRIQITCERSGGRPVVAVEEDDDIGCLGGDFFVTCVRTNDEQSNYMQMNARHSKLSYHTPYYFWKFDYAEQAKVYLGRQLRQTVREGTPTIYRYTMGLRPHEPNQTWTLVPPGCGKQSDAGTAEAVQWGSNVSLVVCGNDTRSGQPDSKEKQVLSAVSRDNRDGGSSWAWYAVDPKGEASEVLRIISNSSDPHETNKTKQSGKDTAGSITTIPLAIHAIPDICDKGAYMLYSPTNWHSHQAPASWSTKGNTALSNNNINNSEVMEGRSAVIEFTHWTSKGILYFQAKLLPFALAIPIMRLDQDYFQPHLGLVANLFESYSARWGCIKYYMATAADVGEGCRLQMDTFLGGVTDHEEHSVEYDDSSKVVTICMQEPIDMTVPDTPRDDSQVWRFFFFW